MSTAPITIDDTHWPLLIVHFVGSPTLSQCQEFFERRASYLERGEPHVGISDGTQMKLPPAGYLALQEAWLVKHGAQLARTLLGVATIVRAPDILLLKSAATYRTPLPYPTLNVTTLRAGVDWAVKRLQEAGLQEPALRIRHAFEGEPPQGPR
jgi:hypothetical protein